MARYRSRRTYRRSASQSAASLLALVLPAPLQRVADTRLGPLLILVAVPALIVAGLLNVNWDNGIPKVSVDPQAAENVLQKTRDRYNNLEQEGGLAHMASDFWNGVSHASHEDIYGQSYPTIPQTAPNRIPTSSFPSTQPQSATTQRDYRNAATQPTNTYSQQPTYSQPQTYTQQQTYTQPPTYAQTGYAPQVASPSNTSNLTSLQQQQLHQQQQYQYQQQQQQLYEQQLREQQYRQWLAQQPAASSQPPSSTGYQQLDAYGRPVSSGYGQPVNNYSQPSTQYGQQNYNQGALPNANTRGRY